VVYKEVLNYFPGSPGLCRWGVPGPSTASSHPVARSVLHYNSGSPGLCRWGVPGPSTASSHPVVRGPAWFIRKYLTTFRGLRAFAAGGSLGPPRRHRIQWPGPSFTTILGLRAFAAGGSLGPPRRHRIQWPGPSFLTILGLRAFAAGGSLGPPRRLRIQRLVRTDGASSLPPPPLFYFPGFSS